VSRCATLFADGEHRCDLEEGHAGRCEWWGMLSASASTVRTVHDVIGPQLDRWRADPFGAGTFKSLGLPLMELERRLGPDTELDERTERFLRWFIDWDSSALLGLAALIEAVERS
jgi:hypothetical protein